MIIFKSIIILFILYSCTPKILPLDTVINKDNENIKIKKDFPYYLIGDPYIIDGITYEPKENYSYSEIGQASYFEKKIHGKKTANNEVIDITALIAAHKTLPLPSVVKITNIENNSSIIVRVNDRGPQNNTDIIMLSAQAAKLLNFYDKKTTQVKIDILEDESKQVKLVAQSINTDLNLETITAAPTNEVKIENIE